MADTVYTREMIITEKGKPTKLVPILVSKDENKTLARAYLTANQTITHNVSLKVSGYTESWDIGSNFASDKYTAPVTGYYHVSAVIYFYDAEGKLTIAQTKVYLDGSEVSRLGIWSGTDEIAVLIGGADIIYMTAGQYLELYGYIQLSTAGVDTAVMASGAYATRIAVHLISKA